MDTCKQPMGKENGNLVSIEMLEEEKTNSYKYFIQIYFTFNIYL